jgi:hypothetical protein
MSEVEELEYQLEQTKSLKVRREQAERLSKNKDFRTLIIDGFCLYDAARFVQLSGDPALRPEERADSLALAQASGHLKRFLQVQIQMGATAERSIAELELAIAEARAEEAAE